MNNSDYDRIDDYLMGRLDSKALDLFERQLQEDMDFAKEVKERKQFIDLLDKVGDIEMKRSWKIGSI